MPKTNKAAFLLLWLFNPFISTIYLFKNFRYNTSIYPYLLLSLFFGISFVVSTTGGDSERYAMDLIQYEHQNLSFQELLANLYTDSGTKIDIYQPFLTWLVSTFTSNVKVLFSVYATIFGFFWFKSLIIVRSQLKIPLKKIALLVFLLLVFTNPIWKINGVRMWTAIGVFFYGILLLHIEDKKKGWVFLLFPMFIHFSLVLPLVLYLFYRLLPLKNALLLFSVYLVTFFLGELDLELVRNYLSLLPDFVQSKDGYLSEEYVEAVEDFRETKSLFYTLAKTSSTYITFFLTCAMYYYLFVKNKFGDLFLNRFYIMALVFLSFSNIMSLIPSGGRFGVLSNLILLTTFLLFLNKRIVLPSVFISIINCLIVFVIIFQLRDASEFIGIFLFIGNPIVNWFIVDIPIIKLLKGLL